MAPQIQRMQADDLLAAAFPDAAACLENIPGDREVPDHPLVRQTVDDCVHEVMDLQRLTDILRRIRSGEIRCLARDLPEPSPLAHEILNAKPYAFLDDAPLEERRTQAVYTRRAFEPGSADDLGALDASAIARVRDEAWPEVQSAEELHDALLTSGFLTAAEGAAGREGRSWVSYHRELIEAGRAHLIPSEGRPGALWVATERLPELQRLTEHGEREVALRELLRGRLGIVGPATADELARPLGLPASDIDAALAALEAEGVVLRGRFTPSAEEGVLEWCERRLLARIHRYTLGRLRAEIEPVTAADFMRFLFAWQRVDPEDHAAGLEGLATVVAQLDGFEVPAGVWEGDVLAARCEGYDPSLLDTLCLTGRVAWGRLTGGNAAGPIRTTPVALFLREHSADWLAQRNDSPHALSSHAAQARDLLESRGASFFHEIVAHSGLLATQVEQALGELAGFGLVTSDSFAGLRALITPSNKRKPIAGARRRHRTAPYGIESAGRWSLLASREAGGSSPAELFARALLQRYGVVFRRLLAREAGAPPWRELLLVYRRLEARGEIRGGRFVAGMPGEQFALPEAVERLRAVRRRGSSGMLVGIAAADPLNLTGIVTPGDRIAAVGRNRILYRDGVPVMALEGREPRMIGPGQEVPATEMLQALVRKPSTPALRSYLGLGGASPTVKSLTRRPGKRRVASRRTSTDS